MRTKERGEALLGLLEANGSCAFGATAEHSAIVLTIQISDGYAARADGTLDVCFSRLGAALAVIDEAHIELRDLRLPGGLNWPRQGRLQSIGS